MTDIQPRIDRTAQIEDALDGMRLDQAVAVLFPEFSRSRLQRWIREGRLTRNQRIDQPRAMVKTGDRIALRAELEPAGEWQATPMPLEIVFEDAHIIVINKPVGLVVHPAAGHANDTLLNGLLEHCPGLIDLPRAGIVHRLDRDTSGLLVIAKTLMAHNHLVAAIQDRRVSREYLAVVNGVLVSGGTIDKPIGRHPRDRKRRAVLAHGGKPAVTHYRVARKFAAHTLLRVILETGRTHQIRVHMAAIGHAIVGDPVYGGRLHLPKGASTNLISCLRGFQRQALHAALLRFEHPETGELLEFEAPMPEDLSALIDTFAVDPGEC